MRNLKATSKIILNFIRYTIMSEFKFEPYYRPKMGYIIKEDNKPKDDFIPLYKLRAIYPERFDHKYIKDVKFKPIYKSF